MLIIYTVPDVLRPVATTVYLHGLIKLDNGRRESQFFVARDPKDEKKVWQDFLKYVGRVDRAVIYTWSRYEFGFVEELWNKYGGDAGAYRGLTNRRIQR